MALHHWLTCLALFQSFFSFKQRIPFPTTVLQTWTLSCLRDSAVPFPWRTSSSLFLLGSQPSPEPQTTSIVWSHRKLPRRQWRLPSPQALTERPTNLAYSTGHTVMPFMYGPTSPYWENSRSTVHMQCSLNEIQKLHKNMSIYRFFFLKLSHRIVVPFLTNIFTHVFLYTHTHGKLPRQGLGSRWHRVLDAGGAGFL